MTLYNVGTKIVNVGATVLMPGDSTPITDEQANVPSIQVLVNHGFLKLGDAPVEKTEDKADDKTEDKTESTADTKDTAETPAETATDAPKEEVKKAVKKTTK